MGEGKGTAIKKSGDQSAQRADEAVEHWSAAEARQFERQRYCSANLRLELHVVKGRG
jgi:hypothetical protein